MDSSIIGSSIQAITTAFIWFVGGLIILLVGMLAYWVRKTDKKFDILFSKFSDHEEDYRKYLIDEAEDKGEMKNDIKWIKRHLKLNGKKKQ